MREIVIWMQLAHDSVQWCLLVNILTTLIYSDTSANENNSFRNHIR